MTYHDFLYACPVYMAIASPGTPPTGTMAGSWGLPLLLLVSQLFLGFVLPMRAPAFGRSDTHTLSPEENEFVEEEEQPVLVLSSEEPEPGPATIDCPRDCACSQEGVVDCGGIDLREFPGDLPEHTNHLSLQVRLMLPQQLSPALVYSLLKQNLQFLWFLTTPPPDSE